MDLKAISVLVTGADGFIGLHLAEILVNNGADVKALFHYNSLIHRIEQVEGILVEMAESTQIRSNINFLSFCKYEFTLKS